YLSGGDGLLLTKEGRMMPPFENLTAAPADLSYKKPSSCKVSPQASYLACQYWSKDLQGIVVWQLLGGGHGFERVAEHAYASSAIWFGDWRRLLASTDGGVLSVYCGAETKEEAIACTWRIHTARDYYVVVHSVHSSQASALIH